MASLVIFILIFQSVAGKEQPRSDSILHHLNSGIKFAKDFLGSESVALKVADFVVRAFQPTSSIRNKRPIPDSSNEYSNENYSEENINYNMHEVPNTMSPIRHLVRLLGLQPKQISAVAVNALIFVAQMITTFLAGPRRQNKSHRSEDFTEWILNKNSRKLQDLLATAKNDSLPNMIEDLILEHESKEETSCIRLFICKITPFVNKMQEAVFGEKTDNRDFTQGTSFMYRHLPTNDEFNSKSEICEQKYKDCKLYE
ncbi:uncharacterized protein LOC123661103 [Melitaea cinxia]|uniref:uncharacterized protein LOC123661103 n=1 Tax=Melitaea cinxia TaxID=113334 RepID=UPI001E272C01|nr:uncharacterized protein LOC123661103 [Melitaea cinxia]XP_045452060.1 uncharacterized protein LOC123661103 [Melitaea cinxia]